MARIDIDKLWMNVAHLVADRATCPRLHVGAVLTRDTRVIATGYNGAPAGQEHCPVDLGHLMLDHCDRATHAERNVIGFCAAEGIPTKGGTLYVTVNPCFDCVTVLIAAQLDRVVYGGTYSFDPRTATMLEQAGITMEELL